MKIAPHVSSILDPNPDWIRNQMSQRIRIGNPDPGKTKLLLKNEKNLEISYFIFKDGSLLGWGLLLEPECPLKGLRRQFLIEIFSLAYSRTI